MAVTNTLDTDDFQGLLLTGYAKRRRAKYALVRFTGKEAKIRQGVKKLSELVEKYIPGDNTAATRERHRSSNMLTVAFTYSGLDKMGFGADRVGGYCPAFKSGMTKRQDVLNDNNIEYWRWGNADNEVHLLLIFFSTEEGNGHAMSAPEHQADGFDTEWEDFRKQLAKGKYLECIGVIEGYVRVDGKEHFGFKDGISQPAIKGLDIRAAERDRCEPGEFILGYQNERGVYPDSPFLKNQDDAPELPYNPRTRKRDLGKNGTYLVLRQLRQKVDEFKTLLEGDGEGPSLAEKMVGRWRSGAPLVLSPDKDELALANANDFSYYYQDRNGISCPLGAHIRRCNPRDNLSQVSRDEDPEEILRSTRQHRIIRRGRIYGGDQSTDIEQTGNDERGLMFLCLNSSIQTQFEFITQTWINNSSFNTLEDETDPLLGLVDNTETRKFTLQKRTFNKTAKLYQYVEVMGGAYFFMPGMAALNYLLTPPRHQVSK